MKTCRLCQQNIRPKKVTGDDGIAYDYCPHYHVVIAPIHELPDATYEKSRYDLHENRPDDAGYIAFLSRAINMASPYIYAESNILDFGCGPSPVLCMEVEKRFNCSCLAYDPFYQNVDIEAKAPYDLIFSTEVFEHFHHPRESIEQVVALLKDQGLLCIMTELYNSLEQFQTWYYTRDETHVTFYHKSTLEKFEHLFGLKLLETDGKRVHLFKKQKTQ